MDVKNTLESTKNIAKEIIKETAHQIQDHLPAGTVEKLSAVGHRVSDGVHEAAHLMDEAVHEAAHIVEEAVHYAEDVAKKVDETAGQYLPESVMETAHQLQDQIKDAIPIEDSTGHMPFWEHLFEKLSYFLSHTQFHLLTLTFVLILGAVFPRLRRVRRVLAFILVANGWIQEFGVISPEFIDYSILNTVVLWFSLFLVGFGLLFERYPHHMYRVRLSNPDRDYPLAKVQYTVETYRGVGGKSKEEYLKKLRAKNTYRSKFDMDRLDRESYAQELDHQDPLKGFRSKFYYPEGSIYFCGNSLGLQPRRTQDVLDEELKKWQMLGVDGHFEGQRPWWKIEDFVTAHMAEVVGAKQHEVAVMNSLSCNIHLMMVPFYRPTKTRFKILIEENPFPSDMYIVTSQIRYHGFDASEALLQVGAREGEDFIRTKDILDVIEEEGDSISLILLGGLQFLSGQAFEFEKITKAAHDRGIIVGFDMAHAAGNLDLNLHDTNCDFACWCSYKYLNSGPGNLGGVFVHENHANTDLQRFAGWWGHKRENRFKLKNIFDPQPGAAGFQLSNPPVVAMCSILPSVEIFSQAGMKNLREKSYHLTTYLELMLETHLKDQVKILTPPDPKQRGCQLSIQLLNQNVKDVMEEFKKYKIICDEREPDVIRVAPTPLYNTYQEVYRFVFTLQKILEKLK